MNIAFFPPQEFNNSIACNHSLGKNPGQGLTFITI